MDKDLESEVPPLKSVPTMRDFSKVFSDDLVEISPEREVKFCIDLLSNTKPISIHPYWMDLAELQELKL